MIIGVDFDNTIVCYDGLFHRLAVQRELVPPSVPPAKNAVRDYLRQHGQEDLWTELQGVVYGPGMAHAGLFPGVLEFFNRCRHLDVSIYIISHRTRYPFRGEQYDLHASARRFLTEHGFDDPARIGLPPEKICFCETKAEKIARINAIGCTHFIDDLPEVLTAAELDSRVQRILFDPNGQYPDSPGVRRIESWPALEEDLLGRVAGARENNGALREPPRSEFAVEGRLAACATHQLPGGSLHAPCAGGTTSVHPPYAAIAALLVNTGLPQVYRLTPLGGGGNNRVYRVDCDGCPFLLKSYFHDPDDPRDRLASEFAFSRFAWDRGVRCIPRPLARDEQGHIGLYEFIEGRMLRTDEIGAREIDLATGFFAALNRHELDSGSAALPVAAEACFTLAEHIACVAGRVQRLRYPEQSECRQEEHSKCTGYLDCQAAAWIRQKLAPAWQRLKDRALRKAAVLRLSLDEPLAMADRCLSPSDFGFHNAILGNDNHLRFIDFEYAGWDDPAKTVCDFLCQPRLPVPERFAARFTDAILADCSDANFHRRRIAVLLPIYRLKWCCILMNEFLPIGSRRRSFADPRPASEYRECPDADVHERRKRLQLQKAQAALQSIEI